MDWAFLKRSWLAWLGQRLVRFEGNFNLSKAFDSLVVTTLQGIPSLSRAFVSLVVTTFDKL